MAPKPWAALSLDFFFFFLCAGQPDVRQGYTQACSWLCPSPLRKTARFSGSQEGRLALGYAEIVRNRVTLGCSWYMLASLGFGSFKEELDRRGQVDDSLSYPTHQPQPPTPPQHPKNKTPPRPPKKNKKKRRTKNYKRTQDKKKNPEKMPPPQPNQTGKQKPNKPPNPFCKTWGFGGGVGVFFFFGLLVCAFGGVVSKNFWCFFWVFLYPHKPPKQFPN